ncbi:MAG: PDC sensor domain-containing protein [Cyanobacteria bacterium J06635_10]
MDARDKQILLTAYKLVNSYGHAWNNRFIDTFFITANHSVVIYWKGILWGTQAKADLDVNQEEYYYTADEKHNPQRKAVWTGLYYDATAKDWMVSALTPAYDNNNNLIGVAGQDIILDDLMKNTINDQLPGTYNLIFQKDGRLIVHPKYMKELKEGNGRLNIQELV